MTSGIRAVDWIIVVAYLVAIIVAGFAFSGEECADRTVTFKVTGRCGDPDAGQQSKSIEATLDAAETPPAPTPTLTDVYSREDEPGTKSTQDADNHGDDENKPSQTNPVTVEVPIK